jgi:bifunctional NMN adenylyltransferase/nudix hydrolase
MTYGVFIGRFQPPTVAHCAIIQSALQKYDRVIVLIGSSRATISTRNPFSYEERESMLTKVFYKEVFDYKLFIKSIADSNYNFASWLQEVQHIVESEAGKAEVTLLGFFKDASSYYLNHFPQWKFENINEQYKGLSATQIRQNLLTNQDNWWPDVVPEIKDYIIDWKAKNKELFDYLNEEMEFITRYKASWSGIPYPVTFVTTDTVVICKGHVLLVQRGRNPGKGLFALPGGFINQNETLERCALRELKEETKIDVPTAILKNSIKKVKVFDDPIRDPRGRFITHAHLILLDQKDLPEVKGSDDASDARWVSYSDTDRYSNVFYADHYQIIKNFLAEV